MDADDFDDSDEKTPTQTPRSIEAANLALVQVQLRIMHDEAAELLERARGLVALMESTVRQLSAAILHSQSLLDELSRRQG